MKLTSKEIIKTSISGKERSMDIVILKNLKYNKPLVLDNHRVEAINSLISIYYKTKNISIKDLTCNINCIIIAVVKRTAIIQ